MRVRFQKVEKEKQLLALTALADAIWHECFPGIITVEQIDYMVQKFQSYGAICQQMREGYLYYLFILDGEIIGYTGIHPEEDGRLFLSKLYLKKEYRGQGFASEAFAFLEQFCKDYGLSSIWLTVNRGNAHSILVYEKKGFVKVRTQVADIGNGFVMDDYIMEKRIS